MQGPSPRAETVPPEGEGQRIDKWLATWPEILSRSRAAQLIDDKRVIVNGKDTKSSYLLKPGDVVQVSLPEAKTDLLRPFDLALEVLFEDKDVLVVNKPSGLVVHPAAGHADDTLVNALIAHTRDLAMGFGEHRPGIVHRLDKETSGLLVVAKNDSAQASLVSQFQDRTIHRLYQALCFGELKKPEGRIESVLARHPVDRKKFASTRSENGKWAATRWRRLSVHHQMSFVELKLETGRTHQIRVHLSEAGHPLVGDGLYGNERRLKSLESPLIREQVKSVNRFFLHARELGFEHPRTKEFLRFSVEWPDPAYGLLKQWGFL